MKNVHQQFSVTLLLTADDFQGLEAGIIRFMPEEMAQMII